MTCSYESKLHPSFLLLCIDPFFVCVCVCEFIFGLGVGGRGLKLTDTVQPFGNQQGWSSSVVMVLFGLDKGSKANSDLHINKS